MKLNNYVEKAIERAVLDNEVSGAKFSAFGGKPKNIKVVLGEVMKVPTRSFLGTAGEVSAVAFTATMSFGGEEATMNGHAVLGGLNLEGEWTQ